MRINGKSWDKTYVQHADLTRGGHIDLQMGPRASAWGTAPSAAPPSLTTGSKAANPPVDQTGPGSGTATTNDGTDPGALFDNDSNTAVAFPAGPESVTYRFDRPHPIAQYTLTSAAQPGGDPAAWKVSVSTDGTHWTEVDRRSGERFAWRQQTRAFTPSDVTGSYQYVRFDFDPPTDDHGLRLSEVELLAKR